MSAFASPSDPSGAYEPQTVLKALQKQDQLLTQGTLTYRRHFAVASSEGVFLPKDQKDSSVRRVISSQDDVRKLMEGPRNVLEDCELIFTREDHFWRSITKLDPSTEKPLASSSTIITIYDGQNESTLIGDHVTLSSNKFPDLREGARTTSMYPGPCFMMGRGLSLLQDIKIESKDGKLNLTGSLKNGTVVEAELDALHGYLAKKIVKKRMDGTISTTVELDTPIKMGQCFIASHTLDSIFGQGKTEAFIKSEYSIQTADDQPRAVDFSPILKNGSRVLDARLGRAISWNMKENQTPAQLLPQTQKELQERAERQAQYEGAQRGEKLQRIMSLLSPAILLGLLLSWCLVKVRKKQSR